MHDLIEQPKFKQLDETSFTKELHQNGTVTYFINLVNDKTREITIISMEMPTQISAESGLGQYVDNHNSYDVTI